MAPSVQCSRREFDALSDRRQSQLLCSVINQSVSQSKTELDFSVNRFFMKLFNTSYIQTVTECQLIFGFKLPSIIIADKSKIFLIKYDSGNNLLFKLFRLSYRFCDI